MVGHERKGNGPYSPAPGLRDQRPPQPQGPGPAQRRQPRPPLDRQVHRPRRAHVAPRVQDPTAPLAPLHAAKTPVRACGVNGKRRAKSWTYNRILAPGRSVGRPGERCTILRVRASRRRVVRYGDAAWRRCAPVVVVDAAEVMRTWGSCSQRMRPPRPARNISLEAAATRVDLDRRARLQESRLDAENRGSTARNTPACNPCQEATWTGRMQTRHRARPRFDAMTAPAGRLACCSAQARSPGHAAVIFRVVGVC